MAIKKNNQINTRDALVWINKSLYQRMQMFLAQKFINTGEKTAAKNFIEKLIADNIKK